MVPEVSEPNEALPAQLRSLTPFLLRYLHHREPDVYDRLKMAGKLGRLGAMLARTCEQPRARLVLGGVTVEVERPVVVTEDALYVSPEAVADSDYLGIALAFWLGSPKGLEDFLVSLLEKREDEKVRRFLARKGIPELPAEEKEGIGEAEGLAVFGGSGMASETESPVEEPISLLQDASDGRKSLGESEASQSGKPVGQSSPLPPPKARHPPEGDSPPTRPSGLATQEKQRTGSRPVPQPSAPRLDAHRPPLLATERPPGIYWRQCVPKAAQVTWTAYEASQPRSSRPIASPNIPPAPEQKGPADSADSKPDDPPDVRSAVGRWGEEYAVHCLLGELQAKYPEAVLRETAERFCLLRGGVIVAEVVWLNRHGEQGVGYDIEVLEGNSRLFVEVKSTRDDARACFDISEAQWEKAKVQGNSYRITRIYNAGRFDAHAVHISNPYRAWQEGELSIRSLRIVL